MHASRTSRSTDDYTPSKTETALGLFFIALALTVSIGHVYTLVTSTDVEKDCMKTCAETCITSTTNDS